MGAWGALLDPADVQRPGGEVDLVPAQVHQFGRPKAVPVGCKDHCRVAVAMAVSLDRCNQPLDFGFRQVFAGAELVVWGSLGCDCSIYGAWCDKLEVRFCHVFSPSLR
jgi:hypothetical protein